MRQAALRLMVVTAFTIFPMELLRLSQLSPVASIIGIAAVLILVSFLYQGGTSGVKHEYGVVRLGNYSILG